MRQILTTATVLAMLMLAIPALGEQTRPTQIVNLQELNYKVITSRGSMRLVQYTRNTRRGQTSYIRAEPLTNNREVVASHQSQSKAGPKAVATAKPRFVIRRSTANAANNQPRRKVSAAAIRSSNNTVTTNIYARPSYVQQAYLANDNETKLALADEGINPQQVQNPNPRLRKTTGNNEVFFARPIDWDDQSRFYVNHRHHRGCGCRYAYRYNPGYGNYYSVNRHCVSTYGYKRLLGNGTYVRKQPCFSNRNFYRSRGYARSGHIIAITHNRGHSLTIGGRVKVGY